MPPPIVVAQIFADKLTEDNRQPVAFLTIPFLDGDYGVLLPALSFWLQLVVLLAFQTVLCTVLAVIIYHAIVKRRGTLAAHLIGYGIILPSVLAFPYALIQHLDIQNVMIRFVLYLPTLISFRCLEAMHTKGNIAAESSVGRYVLYYACLIEVQYSLKTNAPQRLTGAELAKRLWRVLAQYFVLSILYSVVAPYSFAPFRVPKPAHSTDHSVVDIFHIGHLSNNLVGAYLMFLILSFSQSAVAFATNLFRIRTIDVMHNPLMKSTSPTDFWSRRWNQVIHSLLKRGVFKPIVGHVPRAAAVGATFLVSGLLHEYIWSFIFYLHTSNGAGAHRFYPTHGKSMLFFAYNAFVMTMEKTIGHWPLFRIVSNRCPSPLTAMLVLLTALPCSHLFTGDLIAGGYFSDFAVALPLTIRVYPDS